jgi:hypothetical protein
VAEPSVQHVALGRFLKRPEQTATPAFSELLLQRALDLAALSARQHMECGVPKSMKVAFVRVKAQN